MKYETIKEYTEKQICIILLMTAYLIGDEKAGEIFTENATEHFLLVALGVNGAKLLSEQASALFAETHLGQKVGSFFAKAFERTSIGCDGALEILNRISPKYPHRQPDDS